MSEKADVISPEVVAYFIYEGLTKSDPSAFIGRFDKRGKIEREITIDGKFDLIQVAEELLNKIRNYDHDN